MKILIFPSREATEKAAAHLLLKEVQDNPQAVLGLATGGTAKPIYEIIVKEFQLNNISFANVTTYNLDEYVGLAPDHPQSYRTFMQQELFVHVDIITENTHVPQGNSDDAKLEAARFDQNIGKAGGIDWQLLGIGENGHIGFNEPTSSLSSRTRVKTLSKSTIDANSRYFSDEAVPHQAITMGIGTILDSRKVVLVATGVKKSGAIAAMIEGPISAFCPASVLQMHSCTTVLLDTEAASQLKLTDYYLHVHPDGTDIVR